MHQYKVNMKPLDILKWGLDNVPSVTKHFDKKTLWLNLLPVKKIIPTKKGITIHKQDFVPVADKHFQLLNNLIDADTVDEVSVSYDSRKYDEIYWIYNKEFILLRTRGKDDVVYSNEWEVKGTNQIYVEKEKEFKSIEDDIQIENDKWILASILNKPKPAQIKI